ncbi:DUF2922 family protein [Heliobacterium undosum]|uniref:DUF2922 family protein n=1 Tax=Heliomicrobium undosum TaxID=121734 RepID=A0A845L8U6_9FIRM|nr:DUF2922 domain-containing protein [Heliomicrobium undosum]MZP31050.1 DUF2922 family protein [Heliomicrobium undosum]
MASKETLELVFTNQLGREVVLRVKDPKADLTPAQVTAAMDTIIASNVFTTAGGDLVNKKDVRLVSSNVTDLWNP